jgi:hypothetical protein
MAATASAQAAPPVSSYYARTNTYSVFGAYSGDSSHILLGDAENRRLLEFGASYGRKLVLTRIVNWQYNGELLPVVLESDPVVHTVFNQTTPVADSWTNTVIQAAACVPESGKFSDTITYSGVASLTPAHTFNRAFAIGLSAKEYRRSAFNGTFCPGKSYSHSSSATAGICTRRSRSQLRMPDHSTSPSTLGQDLSFIDRVPNPFAPSIAITISRTTTHPIRIQASTADFFN